MTWNKHACHTTSNFVHYTIRSYTHFFTFKHAVQCFSLKQIEEANKTCISFGGKHHWRQNKSCSPFLPMWKANWNFKLLAQRHFSIHVGIKPGTLSMPFHLNHSPLIHLLSMAIDLNTLPEEEGDEVPDLNKSPAEHEEGHDHSRCSDFTRSPHCMQMQYTNLMICRHF